MERIPLLHLDANRINARGLDQAMTQLERWREAGTIEMEFSRTAYGEASRGSCARANKADEYTWSEGIDHIGDETDRLKAIANIVFGKSPLNRNQANDVRILYDAWKAGAALITEDGNSNSQPRGILGSKKELAQIGIVVLSTNEAIERFRPLAKRNK